MPPTLHRTHGLGVRTDGPKLREPKSAESEPRKAAPKSALLVTYEAAAKKGALKEVPPAEARALEAKFNASGTKTEDLSGGRVGASIRGMVVNGELFVRTKPVRPGSVPKWASAGRLARPSAGETDGVKPKHGWSPRPASLEARVKKAVADRMNLLSNPTFQLKASEVAELKRAIARGEVQTFNATPRGLAGVGLTGYVSGDTLIVEKRAVRPGASSTFHLLGPLN